MEVANKYLKKKNTGTPIINILHTFKKVKENMTMMWEKMEDRERPKDSRKENMK